MLRIALRVRLRSAPLRMTPSVSAAAVEPRSGAKRSAAGSRTAFSSVAPLGRGAKRASVRVILSAGRRDSDAAHRPAGSAPLRFAQNDTFGVGGRSRTAKQRRAKRRRDLGRRFFVGTGCPSVAPLSRVAKKHPNGVLFLFYNRIREHFIMQSRARVHAGWEQGHGDKEVVALSRAVRLFLFTPVRGRSRSRARRTGGRAQAPRGRRNARNRGHSLARKGW